MLSQLSNTDQTQHQIESSLPDSNTAKYTGSVYLTEKHIKLT